MVIFSVRSLTEALIKKNKPTNNSKVGIKAVDTRALLMSNCENVNDIGNGKLRRLNVRWAAAHPTAAVIDRELIWWLVVSMVLLRNILDKIVVKVKCERS